MDDNADSYIKTRIICPNCGRVAKVAKIDLNRSCKIENIRCRKCPVDSFDWNYAIDNGCVCISISANVPLSEIDKIREYNDSHNFYSNR